MAEAIDKEKITIGRDPSCGVVVADDSISRIHAEMIVLEGGRLFLTDRNSTNGTWIVRNGKEIVVRQEYVYKGDVVRFGDVQMSASELADALPLGPGPVKLVAGPGGASPSPQSVKPWVRGDRLVRCQCGAVKQKDGKCRECGK